MNTTQARAARAILRLHLKDVADAAGISHMTMIRLEGGKTPVGDETRARVSAVYEGKGVTFSEDGFWTGFEEQPHG